MFFPTFYKVVKILIKRNYSSTLTKENKILIYYASMGLGHKEQKKSFKLFIEEVMPEFCLEVNH